MDIRNKAELKRFLGERLGLAINDIIEVIYLKLKEFINEDIYETYTPKVYERTYEFRDKAWDVNFVRDISSKIVASINYNYMKLTVDPDYDQHIDREQLANILNIGSSSGWQYWEYGRGNDVYPAPYWTDTIDWIVKNFKSIALEKLAKRGLLARGYKPKPDVLPF